jgi:putative oxidoreductase
MSILVDTLIEWPRSVARHLDWLGPLVARIVTGWVFLWTGWGKLTHLPLVTQNFEGWGIPAPGLMAPVASGIEFFGGILLLVGLMTRISAGALCVVMIVAVAAVQ